MILSAGDWIAVAVGGVGSLRWALDGMRVDKKEEDGRVAGIDRRLAQMSSDFRVHQAEDRIMFQQVVDSVEKMERTLDRHTRQLGFVASGANDRIVELGGRDDHTVSHGGPKG